jgi:hypothetical protein
VPCRRTDQGVQLGKISDHPHEIAGSEGEHYGRPDDAAGCLIDMAGVVERETDTCWGPLGVKRAAAVMRATTMARMNRTGMMVDIGTTRFVDVCFAGPFAVPLYTV